MTTKTYSGSKYDKSQRRDFQDHTEEQASLREDRDVADVNTLAILKELAEQGIAPNEDLEKVTQDVGGEIINRGGLGDEEDAIPMATIAQKGAGYVTVYHTETGLDSLVSKNMLPAQLRKMLPNGKRAFTTHDPGFRPVEGTLKCFMHAEHEMRKICDDFGRP